MNGKKGIGSASHQVLLATCTSRSCRFLAGARQAQRAAILAAAQAAHPDRFVRGAPRPPALPTEVWINKPQDPKPTEAAAH